MSRYNRPHGVWCQNRIHVEVITLNGLPIALETKSFAMRAYSCGLTHRHTHTHTHTPTHTQKQTHTRAPHTHNTHTTHNRHTQTHTDTHARAALHSCGS